MSAKNLIFIILGSAITVFLIYKFWPTTEPGTPPNTYTLIFFDKTLSNTATYGNTEIESHKNIILKATDNLKVKGDKIKAFYIDAITESAINKTPEAELSFEYINDSNAGYLDQQNEQKEYDRKLFNLKKKTRTSLLKLFEEDGNPNNSTQTDTWGILNKLKIETGALREGDKMEVLIFSDMEESMNSKGKRDFHKNEISTIEQANKFAEEDIDKIRKMYSLNSIPYAENINVKVYFPTAKKGKAKMEAYWTKIFNTFNINLELN